MSQKKIVVVAYSGGLDTSYTVMYLAKEKGYEVHAVCADTGGFSAEQLKTNETNDYFLLTHIILIFLFLVSSCPTPTSRHARHRPGISFSRMVYF